MAQTIKLRRSGVAGKVPSVNDLALGELGLNYADAKLYCRKSVAGQSDTIVELAGGAGGIGGALFSDYGLITEAASSVQDFGGLV